MSEKSIIMQPESVRGIFDDRKTMTRRVVNTLLGFGEITEFDSSKTEGYNCDFRDKRGCWNSLTKKELLASCPYGSPGDELWVRETFGNFGDEFHDPLYRADMDDDEADEWIWRPPIFMPRGTSRLQLLIKDVRVERVQDITEQDAFSEGIQVPVTPDGRPLLCVTRPRPLEGVGPRQEFASLWDSINAKPKPVKRGGKIDHYISYPWEDIRETEVHRGMPWHVFGNPPVWALKFERIDR